jgi:PduT-like ethanolamine utilization protein
MNNALGIIEFRSISKGIEVGDLLCKECSIELLFFKIICPGKFLIILTGDVESVKTSVEKSRFHAKEFLVDSNILTSVHANIIKAIKHSYKEQNIAAVGIFETTNIVCAIIALDKALKSAAVDVVKLTLGFTTGGKGIFVITGSEGDLEEAMLRAEESIEAKRIINISILKAPHQQIKDLITKF